MHSDSEILRGFHRGALAMVLARDGYEWGKETPTGADCSGVVAWAIREAGFTFRCRAWEFYEYVFKRNTADLRNLVDPAFPTVLVRIDAAYWYDRTSRTFHPSMVDHIAPVIPGGFVVDAFAGGDSIDLLTIDGFVKRYRSAMKAIIMRHTFPDILSIGNGRYVSGLDPEWKAIP